MSGAPFVPPRVHCGCQRQLPSSPFLLRLLSPSPTSHQPGLLASPGPPPSSRLPTLVHLALLHRDSGFVALGPHRSLRPPGLGRVQGPWPRGPPLALCCPGVHEPGGCPKGSPRCAALAGRPLCGSPIHGSSQEPRQEPLHVPELLENFPFSLALAEHRNSHEKEKVSALESALGTSVLHVEPMPVEDWQAPGERGR